MIDDNGNARLADFGLLTIISDPINLLSSSSCALGGTARWMSPELIDPQRFGLDRTRPTKSSDYYALAMVIYETITGRLPFHEHTDLNVFVKVLNGDRPRRGPGFADNLWKMLELCWASESEARPSATDVLQCLVTVSELPLSPAGEETWNIGDDWDSGSDPFGKHSFVDLTVFSSPTMVCSLRWSGRCINLTAEAFFTLGLPFGQARTSTWEWVPGAAGSKFRCGNIGAKVKSVCFFLLAMGDLVCCGSC